MLDERTMAVEAAAISAAVAERSAVPGQRPRRRGGHVERAARRLGVPRSSLYERIKRLGIATRRD